jgi:hypothetical protein
MHMIDTEAARALQKIVNGDQTLWPGETRSAWVRFLLSLRFRNPEAVAIIKRQLVNIWDAGVAALKANYETIKQPGYPATFEDYMARTEPSAPFKGALVMLQEIIDNQRLGPSIFNMHWSRVPLSRSSRTLLASDRPLVMPVGLGRPDGYIAIPVGPKMLFVVGNDDRWAKQLGSSDPTKVVEAINMTVVSQARSFVWGRTKASFVLCKIE